MGTEHTASTNSEEEVGGRTQQEGESFTAIEVWRAVLAEMDQADASVKDAGLTLRDVEKGVARRLPGRPAPAVEGELANLVKERLVERVGTEQRYRLSESGQRLVVGLRILANA